MARKWRIVYPGSIDHDAFRTERATYEHVDALRGAWLDGQASGSLTVQVDEGLGWQPYEDINFAEEV
jgi:hypothetical protein